MTKFITINELSARFNVSVCILRANEKRLGLLACRYKINPRVIRYDEEEAIRAVKKNAGCLSNSA